jgi:hypothetical protein
MAFKKEQAVVAICLPKIEGCKEDMSKLKVKIRK